MVAELELDPETSTHHAQFRQYGDGQGSWMSPDPYAGSYDMNNPQSLNRYSYALNNPVTFSSHRRQAHLQTAAARDLFEDAHGVKPSSS